MPLASSERSSEALSKQPENDYYMQLSQKRLAPSTPSIPSQSLIDIDEITGRVVAEQHPSYLQAAPVFTSDFATWDFPPGKIGSQAQVLFDRATLSKFNTLHYHEFLQSAYAARAKEVSGINEALRLIDTLKEEVLALKAQIQRLSTYRVVAVPVASLAPEPFVLLKPITVAVEGDGEDFTATFYEGNVSGSGSTEAEAIANFKDNLLSLFEILSESAEDQLGPLPRRQLTILREVVQRRS